VDIVWVFLVFWTVILRILVGIWMNSDSVSWHNLWSYVYTLSYPRVLLEKLTGFQLVEKSPTFYGTRRFITTFTSTSYENILQQDTFLRWGVVSTSPNPQAGKPPLVGCLQLLTQYICSYPPHWRPFLHPRPDAPRCGDRNPTYPRLHVYVYTQLLAYVIFTFLRAVTEIEIFVTHLCPLPLILKEMFIIYWNFNPVNAELNPICHLLALLGAHHILHVSSLRVKSHLPFAGIIRSSPYSPH